MNYTIIYSSRKTVALSVKDGEVIVRAPRGFSKKRIATFVEGHKDWIEKKLASQKVMIDKMDSLTPADISRMKKEAKVYFTARAEQYAAFMGLKYSNLKITSAKRRFGSCNSNGVICFSYRLMLYPEAARDYVVVHELAHLVHMNHSPAFYALIARYMPDYKERKHLLK